jgi:transporter family protein
MDPRTLVELVSSDSLHSVASPPLAVWIGPALLCALAYAFYNIFIKKGSASIHPILGGVVLQIVAALLGSLLLAYIVIQNSEDEENVLYWDAAGIRWAVCAGAAVGAAEILSFFVSSLGVQAMQSIPTIIGGSVFFGCVLGACLLHEVLTFRGWFGVFLICVGITLVGLEPAVEGAH